MQVDLYTVQTTTCTADSDCAANTDGTTKCVNGKCNECAVDSDCSGATPYCNTILNIDQSVYKLKCGQCSSDDHCAGNANGPVCVNTKCTTQENTCPTWCTDFTDCHKCDDGHQ